MSTYVNLSFSFTAYSKTGMLYSFLSNIRYTYIYHLTAASCASASCLTKYFLLSSFIDFLITMVTSMCFFLWFLQLLSPPCSFYIVLFSVFNERPSVGRNHLCLVSDGYPTIAGLVKRKDLFMSLLNIVFIFLHGSPILLRRRHRCLLFSSIGNI